METSVCQASLSTCQKQNSSSQEEEDARSRQYIKQLSASLYKGSTAKKQRQNRKKIDYTKVSHIIEEQTPGAEETDDFHSCQEGNRQVAPASVSTQYATKLPS